MFGTPQHPAVFLCLFYCSSHSLSQSVPTFFPTQAWVIQITLSTVIVISVENSVLSLMCELWVGSSVTCITSSEARTCTMAQPLFLFAQDLWVAKQGSWLLLCHTSGISVTYKTKESALGPSGKVTVLTFLFPRSSALPDGNWTSFLVAAEVTAPRVCSSVGGGCYLLKLLIPLFLRILQQYWDGLFHSSIPILSPGL